jgi:hypothetical protein
VENWMMRLSIWGLLCLGLNFIATRMAFDRYSLNTSFLHLP